jgi:hypothetical protein
LIFKWKEQIARHKSRQLRVHHISLVADHRQTKNEKEKIRNDFSYNLIDGGELRVDFPYTFPFYNRIEKKQQPT